MEFKFYPIESRIYDFLEFPGLIYVKERYESETREKDELKVPSFAEYLDFLGRADMELEPFRKDIEQFYLKNFFGEYNFIDLISKANSLFGCQSEEQYLEMLLKLSESEINRSIAYSIISESENNMEFSEEIMSRAETLCSDKSEIISLIKDLPTEAASKWNLFLIIEEPVKYMRMYVDLMQKVLPIFTELYGSLEEQVRVYGQNLADFLNENGAKGLEEKTYSILDAIVLVSGENRIIVSAMIQYAISILSAGRHNYIAWGLKMEEAFKRMKEINENKVNERVQVFKNLGDKTRYEVVRMIAAGETSTKEIAQALGVSSATISYHINNLLQSKLIKIDRTESKYGYIVDHKLVEEVIKGLKEDLRILQ